MNQVTMEELEKQMLQTDVRMDELALQVGDIEKNIFEDNADGGEVQVGMLLQSVNEVRSNYQNLRKEISEVQDLQKQLSSSLQVQIRMMQSKFNTLKEKIHTKAPGGDSMPASLSSSVASSLNHMQHLHPMHHQHQPVHVAMLSGNEGLRIGVDHMPVPPIQALPVLPPMPNLLMDVPAEMADGRFRQQY